MTKSERQEIKDKEAILQMIYSYVKKVKHDRYIVADNGLSGVITLDEGVIIPLKFSKITNSEYYFRTYGDAVDTYARMGQVYDVRESGLYNMDGKEVVPLGIYHVTNNVKGFGIGLFNMSDNVSVIATNKEIVKTFEGRLEKLESVNLPGYAAITFDYRMGHEEEFRINHRKVFTILDLDGKQYDDLLHYYDKIELNDTGEEIRAYKDGIYTVINFFGLPIEEKWYKPE